MAVKGGIGRRRVLSGGAGLGLALAAASPGPLFGQGAEEADLALALGADCSGSVREEQYRLQQKGYADAFRDPRVAKAIRGGIHGSIAVCYFQWSGFSYQTLILPWTRLKQPAEIAAFATAMEQAPRTIFSGGTAPGGAIEFARQYFTKQPYRVPRRVVDVSGDGRTNSGPPAELARDRAAAEGITINGLPILHMESDVDDYYEKSVIGGPGAFLISARDFTDFAEAVRRKLILEIAGLLPFRA